MDAPSTLDSVLDRELIRIPLRLSTLVVCTLIVAAVLTRFWDLGSRALHHDESLHAVFSYYLYNGQGYQHDPLMHGPVLFHITALVFWLVGDSDFTVRVAPALFGVAIVLFPMLLRKWLSWRGVLAAMVLTLISPTILYYSRFIRHDVFALLWTLIIVYGVFKYLEDGRDRWLLMAGAGLALLYATKEIAFLFSAVLWGFLALVALTQWLHGRGSLVRSQAGHLVVLIAGLLAPLATALVVDVGAAGLLELGWDAWSETNPGVYATGELFGIVSVFLVLFAGGAGVAIWRLGWRRFLMIALPFYVIFLLFHTTFLTNGRGVASGFVGALGYWLDQHDVQRGGQPWYYYLILLWLYEYLALAVGLLGAGRLLLSRSRTTVLEPDGTLRVRAVFPLFLLWWLVASFILYSIAGEKMPWLSVHMSLPAIWLAAWTLGAFFDRVAWDTLATVHGGALVAALVIVVVACLTLLSMVAQRAWPLAGMNVSALGITGRWLAALIVLGAAGWFAWRTTKQLGSTVVADAAVLILLIPLVVMTVRHAWLASFVHGDVAEEMLIYTQTSPDVPMVRDDIRALSKRLAGDRSMVVAYDEFVSWPFEWYLRHFPNKCFYGSDPAAAPCDLSTAPVVLVEANTPREDQVRTRLPGYVRHQYTLRWWFPEDYKDIRQVRVQTPDPDNPGQTISETVQTDSPLVLLRNAWEAAQPAQARQDVLDFLLYRDLRHPLGGVDFAMYVRPDLVQQIWQYDAPAQPADAPAQPTDTDAYAEQQVPLAADQIIAAGQLNSPRAVAVGPAGQIVVADSGNHRIQVFAPNGDVQTVFGAPGSGTGDALGRNEPWGVAVGPDGSIYVADTWNHRIQKFTAEGEFLTAWGSFADTQGALTQPASFWGPRGLAVDSQGRVYVADTGNKRIQVFDEDGTFLDMFGGAGNQPGQMQEPTGVAVAPDGTIFVADTWNRRVQVFDSDFDVVGEWPVRGWASESVVNKPAIATDGERVWVTDPEAHRVIEFDRSGVVDRVWGGFGAGAASFNLPIGLAYHTGTLVVADSANHRLMLFDVTSK